MNTTPTLAPALLPGLVPAEAGVLPVTRIQEQVMASGARYGCWVLQTPDGQPLQEDRDLHFGDRQDAAAELAATLQHLQAGQERPRIMIAQLPLGCFTLSCTRCGADLGDEELGYAVAHFAALPEVERFAEDRDWTTDGQSWNCGDCPPLECLPGVGDRW